MGLFVMEGGVDMEDEAFVDEISIEEIKLGVDEEAAEMMSPNANHHPAASPL